MKDGDGLKKCLLFRMHTSTRTGRIECIRMKMVPMDCFQPDDFRKWIVTIKRINSAL